MWMAAGHSAATSLFDPRHDKLRCPTLPADVFADCDGLSIPASGIALSDGGHLSAPVNRGFPICPMLAKPNEIRMLSVKKEHPLGGNFELRRRQRSRCTNLRQLFSADRSCFHGYLLLIAQAAGQVRRCSPQSPLPITTTYLQQSSKPFDVPADSKPAKLVSCNQVLRSIHGLSEQCGHLLPKVLLLFPPARSSTRD